MSDIGFAPNYTNLYLLNITPDAPEPTWAYIGPGISSVETNDDEETDDTAYYDGGGVSGQDVTGVTAGYTFAGNRKYGDLVQEFVVSLRLQTGEGRKTQLRHIAPNGEMFEGTVTIQNIEVNGGDANEKGSFSFDAMFDGIPSFIAGDKTKTPESMEVAAPQSLTVGGTAALQPTVAPTTASAWCVYASQDDSIAKVDALGNVTGVKAGTTKVSVKAVAKPSVVQVVEVTVSEAA